MKPIRLIGEAIIDLVAQRFRTLLIIAVLSGLTVMMFSFDREARSSRAELSALLDSPIATLVRIKAYQSSVEIPRELPVVVSRLGSVAESFALSQPVDVTNDKLGSGRSALLRWFEGSNIFGDSTEPSCESAIAMPVAQAQLGLIDGLGSVAYRGLPISVAAVWAPPESLAFLNDSVLLRPCDDTVPLKELVIVVNRPTQVQPVLDVALQLFPVEDRSRLEVESQLEQIESSASVSRAASRAAMRLSLLSAIGNTALVSLLFGAVVVQRRRDFGRRRALGATGQYVCYLVVVQGCVATVAAVLLAVVVTAIGSRIGVTTLPSSAYLLGSSLMLVCGAAVGSFIPGVLAATGDPLRELRIP